jgi:hypothetical protein
MNPLIRLKQTTSVFLVAFGLVCFGLLRTVQAVSPPPDGGYPGENTAEGQDALLRLTTGTRNMATGAGALSSNTTGNDNTASGAGALFSNTTGSYNTAIGALTLRQNTTGRDNTATGVNALDFNTIGTFNTANGRTALYSNTTGSDNTAIGGAALYSNATGINNTAVGFVALNLNDGSNNTAIGNHALWQNRTGSGNVALGFQAGQNVTMGSGNVYIGTGMEGIAGEDNHTYIRNINGTTVSGAGTDTVTVNLTTGLLGHLSSSRRYKDDIKPMNDASEGLYRLKPVTYRYKEEIDRSQTPAFGLIAEDVAEVNPALVARNVKGQAESIHYEMINAMLLNEFLKEHKAFVEERSKVQELEANAARQQKQIETLMGGLQKVSAQLELNKAAPQTVKNAD